ncbi:MAG TPA: hypothetical protein VEI57_14050 [Nitrospirota bacterium]|nr:hypothetical protein [Nitrospirota bacterium]
MQGQADIGLFELSDWPWILSLFRDLSGDSRFDAGLQPYGRILILRDILCEQYFGQGDFILPG